MLSHCLEPWRRQYRLPWLQSGWSVPVSTAMDLGYAGDLSVRGEHV